MNAVSILISNGKCIIIRNLDHIFVLFSMQGFGDIYQNLVKCINVHSPILKTHLFGRTVVQKIRKLDNRYSFMNKFYRSK